MKKYNLILTIQLVLILSTLLFQTSAIGQSGADKNLIEDCKEGKADFIHTDRLMKNLFDSAYGYVLFPNVGKGAIGVGGAAGNGIVYQKETMIGKAKLTQVTLGFQFGGQAYREVIFFENKETLDRFKKN